MKPLLDGLPWLILVGLQVFQVAILLLHDWIPLGKLNDLAAVRRQHSTSAIAVGTLVSSIFPVVGLALSVTYGMYGRPSLLPIYLLAAYGFLFIGELEAWWIPYLMWPQPERASKYRAMFDSTSAFLPRRNGIRINTLHCVLHAATLATVLMLASYFLGAHLLRLFGSK